MEKKGNYWKDDFKKHTFYLTHHTPMGYWGYHSFNNFFVARKRCLSEKIDHPYWVAGIVTVVIAFIISLTSPSLYKIEPER